MRDATTSARTVERARRRVDLALERIYGRRGLEAWAVFGHPDDCVRGLRAVAEAGAELIQLNPVFGLTEQREQMERLAAEVLPRLS